MSNDPGHVHRYLSPRVADGDPSVVLPERNGGAAAYASGWPFRSKLVTWKPWIEHLADIQAKRRTGEHGRERPGGLDYA
jgi:hypothetical protein